MAFFGRNEATKNPLSRRVFFWVLATSFATITTTILFFTLGYRYTFIDDIFVHTGSINFKSEPRKLDIRVDGKKPNIKPFNFVNGSYHITGLRHGPYTLQASAPGYKPWSKDIVIRSGVATQFWNVVLVKENYENRPLQVINPLGLYFTPNSQFLAYPQKETEESSLYVPIVEVQSDQVVETVEIPFTNFTKKENQNIEWAPNGRFLAVPIERTALPADSPLFLANDETLEQGTVKEDSLGLEALPGTDKSRENTATSKTSAGSNIGLPADPLDQELLDQESLDRDAPQTILEQLLRSDEDGILIDLKNSVKDYALIDQDDRDRETGTPSDILYLSTLIGKLDDTLKNHNKRSISPIQSPDFKDSDGLIVEPTVLDTTLPPRMIRWHPKRANTLLTLLGTDLLIFGTDRENGNAQVFYKDVLAYDFADDGIYILKTDGSLLWGRNFDPVGNAELLFTVPVQNTEANNHRLIAYDNSRILTIDDTEGSLTIYNSYEDNITQRIIVEEGLQGTQFSDDGKKVLYHTSNAAGVYFTREWEAQPYRETNEQFTVLDTDDEIQTLQWTSDYEHFVAVIGNSLFLAELDNRGEFRVEEFLTRDLVDKNVIMDQRSFKLYYTDNQTDEALGKTNIGLFEIDFPYEKPGIFR